MEDTNFMTIPLHIARKVMRHLIQESTCAKCLRNHVAPDCSRRLQWDLHRKSGPGAFCSLTSNSGGSVNDFLDPNPSALPDGESSVDNRTRIN